MTLLPFLVSILFSKKEWFLGGSTESEVETYMFLLLQNQTSVVSNGLAATKSREKSPLPLTLQQSGYKGGSGLVSRGHGV